MYLEHALPFDYSPQAKFDIFTGVICIKYRAVTKSVINCEKLNIQFHRHVA